MGKEKISLKESLSQMSEDLHQAYRTLEEKFEILNKRLEETNLELKKSLAEKDKISFHLDHILNSLTSGVVALDSSGKINLFNKAAGFILGYESDEVVGKSFSQILLPHLGGEKSLATTLEQKLQFLNEEKEIITRSGQRIPVGFSTGLLADNKGEIIGAVEIFFDISKIKKLEEEYSRARTLSTLGEMAATLAHEVRNQLGGIAGFASLLDHDMADTDQRKKSVKKIIGGVENLNKIVSNLLCYAKTEKLSLQKVDLVKFLEEIINFYEIDLKNGNKKIQIWRSFPWQTFYYKLDPEKFRIVVLNIFSNAAAAMPKGGKIRISLVEDQKFLYIKISDSGSGMDAETKEKLFTPFFTTKTKGTGLGLATAKKIIEAHRGEITVESELNKGTEIILSFPKI